MAGISHIHILLGGTYKGRSKNKVPSLYIIFEVEHYLLTYPYKSVQSLVLLVVSILQFDLVLTPAFPKYHKLIHYIVFWCLNHSVCVCLYV